MNLLAWVLSETTQWCIKNMSGIEYDLIFKYWGKADDKYPAEPKWHPLAYHCLDVAAVAANAE